MMRDNKKMISLYYCCMRDNSNQKVLIIKKMCYGNN
ncbi:hypothetical protein M2132_000961 [Dysgonomonas sp. PH5-45]|nr:hypothetical protein [Dysgonomonas sp. PH5-45]MDH6387531.1 hypothetical protein [Dysgonomonas sp. PH5-37]